MAAICRAVGTLVLVPKQTGPGFISVEDPALVAKLGSVGPKRSSTGTGGMQTFELDTSPAEATVPVPIRSRAWSEAVPSSAPKVGQRPTGTTTPSLAAAASSAESAAALKSSTQGAGAAGNASKAPRSRPSFVAPVMNPMSIKSGGGKALLAIPSTHELENGDDEADQEVEEEEGDDGGYEGDNVETGDRYPSMYNFYGGSHFSDDRL